MIESRDSEVSNSKSLSYDGNGSKTKVIIVESETIIAEDLRLHLTDMGYDITAVTHSAKAAIDFAKKNPPDVLLMDLDEKREEINAADTAVILQGYFSKVLPVVFVTSYAETEFPVLKALDVYVYCKKPFSHEDLEACLAKAIALKKEANS